MVAARACVRGSHGTQTHARTHVLWDPTWRPSGQAKMVPSYDNLISPTVIVGDMGDDLMISGAAALVSCRPTVCIASAPYCTPVLPTLLTYTKQNQ